MGHARSADKSDLLFLFQREVHTEHIEFLETTANDNNCNIFFLSCFTPRKNADRKIPNSIVVIWCVYVNICSTNILQLLSLAVVSGILYVLCVLLFGTETVDQIYPLIPASLPEKMPTGRFQTALSLYDVYMLISVVPFSSLFNKVEVKGPRLWCLRATHSHNPTLYSHIGVGQIPNSIVVIWCVYVNICSTIFFSLSYSYHTFFTV